ncbi:MAG: NAD(P)H-binding protein [Flavobacterium sp. JAD_PAG50586_2]|nr:MAG: NAD(P)H-binding protein [Flavobacterium sp. JAD_PAG50586_2]
MKIIVTGSLGNISKPLAIELVQKGHEVTIISSNVERQHDIEAIGAKAAIGKMQDVVFLSETFKDADIVYCMETHDRNAFFDPNLDLIEAITQIGKNYKQAIEQSGVKKVLHLSSIGAHADKGNGILRFHYEVEKILNQLPHDVSIKFMRPVGFFTNLLRSIPTLKTKGKFISNYGGDKKEPWVSPIDIAATIAEEIELPFEGRSIRYIASEEVAPNEIAEVLGKAIGTDLEWSVVSDEDLLKEWLAIGMNKQIAEGYLAMQASQGSGLLYEDYYKNKPTLGKVKLSDFAIDFAKAFNQ